MFGRVRRQSMSSLQQLEMEERLPSKITKHDSLSIYETTLRKLKEGSQRNLSQLQDGSAKTDSSSGIVCNSSEQETIATEACCSSADSSPNSASADSSPKSASADSSPNSAGGECICFSKDQKSRNVSVLYLFSKYNSSQQAKSSPDEDAMLMEDGDYSSASNSPCSDITS